MLSLGAALQGGPRLLVVTGNTFDGGTGYDLLYLGGLEGAFDASANTTLGFEDVHGTAFDDVLGGGSGNITLSGGEGYIKIDIKTTCISTLAGHLPL